MAHRVPLAHQIPLAHQMPLANQMLLANRVHHYAYQMPNGPSGATCPSGTTGP